MKPWNDVPSDLRGVLDELRELEPLFHRYGPDATAADVDATMAPEFWEIGASGQRYGRAFVRDTVVERLRNPGDDPWTCSEFGLTELAQHVFLLTYVLEQAERRTMRSTIWRRDPDGWRVVFHQGTIAAPATPPGG